MEDSEKDIVERNVVCPMALLRPPLDVPHVVSLSGTVDLLLGMLFVVVVCHQVLLVVLAGAAAVLHAAVVLAHVRRRLRMTQSAADGFHHPCPHYRHVWKYLATFGCCRSSLTVTHLVERAKDEIVSDAPLSVISHWFWS